MVDAGDQTCAENQLLHGQKLDVIQKIYDNPFYDPEVADPLNLNLLVADIDVPVFMAGAWQDEQTGPGFASLLDKFQSSPLFRATVYNGVHPDGYAPQVLVELNNFLSLYVADEIPVISELVRSLVPILFQQQFGDALALPPDRFAEYIGVARAKADYEAEKPIRVIFENGAGTGQKPGVPAGAWEANFSAWPPVETAVRRWYFQPDGTMGEEPPVSDGASVFSHDPDEGRRSILAPGGDVWATLPQWNWAQPDPGRAIVFESETLATDLVMVGFASVDLWIQSTADDADIEVTLSEVRPDGHEMYVQSGWLRASLRALDEQATELRPVKTYLEKDAQALPSGEWALARVEMSAFGHAFRAGSRIRVSIDTPGGSRAEWQFALKEFAPQTEISVAHSATHPSSIALPLLPTVAVPATVAIAPCPSLRAQPCREYQSYTNTSAAQ